MALRAQARERRRVFVHRLAGFSQAGALRIVRCACAGRLPMHPS